MALENFLDVNPVEDLVRGSGFQTVGTIASSSVNPLELELFIRPISRAPYRKTAGKIALPLIKLYCSTKWSEDE